MLVTLWSPAAERYQNSKFEAPTLNPSAAPLHGGSWDFVTRVINSVTILITPIRVLMTSCTKSHDPPSSQR